MALTALKASAHRARGLVMSVSIEGPATVVALQGVADVATLALVRRMFDRVVRDYAGPVVADLTDTTFIDSATIRVVSQIGRALKDQGRLLTIRSHPVRDRGAEARQRVAARALSVGPAPSP